MYWHTVDNNNNSGCAFLPQAVNYSQHIPRYGKKIQNTSVGMGMHPLIEYEYDYFSVVRKHSLHKKPANMNNNKW